MSPVNCEVSGTNFTKFSHNIFAVNAPIYVAISHTVSERHSDESGEFVQHRLPWQRFLTYQKRGPDRSSTPTKLSFRVKFAKIGPADLEIICL